MNNLGFHGQGIYDCFGIKGIRNESVLLKHYIQWVGCYENWGEINEVMAVGLWRDSVEVMPSGSAVLSRIQLFATPGSAAH